jgi:FixJ family two-component response regulator
MAAGRLLILDDDPAVGQLLVFVAQSVGFESRLTMEATAFFADLAAWQPSHVAIDLTMPGVGGLEVMRRMAALGSRAGVIISSGAGPEEVAAAMALARELGLVATGALPKPFSVQKLRALLDEPAG